MNLIDMNSQDIKVRLGESVNFLAVIYFEKKKSDMRKKNKIKVIWHNECKLIQSWHTPQTIFHSK